MSATYPQTRAGNGLATAALVCGIVGIFVFEVVLGPLAIIFGAVALGRANRGAAGRGQAIAGLILGIVDVALFVLLLALVRTHGGYWHVG